jgi:hypothetical protein
MGNTDPRNPSRDDAAVGATIDVTTRRAKIPAMRGATAER